MSTPYPDTRPRTTAVRRRTGTAWQTTTAAVTAAVLALLVSILGLLIWVGVAVTKNARSTRRCATDAGCPRGSRCDGGQCTDLPPVTSPSAQFSNTVDTLPPQGGFLGHMSASEDFEAALKTSPFEFGLLSQGVADCAANHRHTCSAWTYLRSDLPPVLFISPSSPVSAAGYWTPLCGVLIDPVLAWPLIASMSIVDSDTNLRSCCGNESGANVLLATSYSGSNIGACVGQVKDWVVYLPAGAVGSCPTSCRQGDVLCRAVNAGGGINGYDLVNWPSGDNCDCLSAPQTPSAADLKDLEGQAGRSLAGYTFFTLKTCPMCAGPYACSTTPLTDNADYESTKDGARAYVGPSGSGFGKLFYSADWANFNLGDLAVRQCKFLRDSWSQWINGIKDFYAQANASLQPNNEMPGKLSYLQANPCNPSYLENEVNVYVDPAAPQDDIFRDAIVGFYWVSTTCAEQLAPLERSTTTDGTAGCTYTDAASRCTGFICNSTTECPELAQQRSRIAAARNASRKMTAQFNRTYRAGKPQVVCYNATPAQNTFFDKQTLQRVASGTVKFEDIFTVDRP